MSMLFSEVVARSTIDSIISKGKYQMYQKQVQTKLPNHVNQEVNSTIASMVNGVYPNNGKAQTLNPEQMILLSNNQQSWSPNKIVVNKKKINLKNKLLQKRTNQFLTIQDQFSSRKKNIIRNRPITNRTVDLSERNIKNSVRQARTTQVSHRKKYIELQLETINNKSIDDEVLLKRNQLNEKRKIQKNNEQQNQKQQKRNNFEKYLLKQQFQKAKIPEQNGSYKTTSPQKNQIVTYQSIQGKILINMNKKTPKTFQNIINLRFQQKFKQKLGIKQQEEQAFTKFRKITDSSRVTSGRGITDKQYNNSGLRQLSCIPYLTITHGICLSQRSIQASVSRARPTNQVSRQKFIRTIQNNSFQSYSKNLKVKGQFQLQKTQRSEQKNMEELQKNKGSKSNLHETNESFGKSILWRPNTSRQKSRIKVNPIAVQQLIK